MGFEIGKGKYVTFDTDELADLRPASTRAIEVTDFVPLAEVDPIYFERTYWLVPDGDPAKAAYQLLLAAMEDRERVAIGTVVMRNKQYLAAIRPLDRRAGDVDHALRRRGRAPLQGGGPAQPSGQARGQGPEDGHQPHRRAGRRLAARRSTTTPSPRSSAGASRPRTPARRSWSSEEPEPTDAKVLDLLSALEASVDAARSGRSRKGRAGKARAAKGRSAKAGSATAGSAKTSARARKSA